MPKAARISWARAVAQCHLSSLRLEYFTTMRKRMRSASVFAAIIAVFLGIALPFRGVYAARKSAATAPIVADAVARDADTSEAARLNSIGVAYMNQQRFAAAQKQFDGALKAQPDS